MLEQITPVILTYNEAPNIDRTLKALQWAKRVVVLDSYSDDATQDICANYPNVDFIQREFDTHAQQWKAAISQNIDSAWVLALDADYVLSDELINELRQLSPSKEIGGYRGAFIYKIDGKPLRGTLYPPVTCLYRLNAADYVQDGHTQRVVVQGAIGELHNKIFHDDRKPSARWHRSQRAYAKQEAQKFANTKFKHLSTNDKLRYVGLGPLLVLPYTLLLNGTLLDGYLGLRYAGQRFMAEVYLLLARVLRQTSNHN